MNELKISTTTVHPDEGTWGLYVGPRDGRFITAVYVERGDAIAEYLIDHGPLEEWLRIPTLMVPSFGEMKVGEMLEESERHRHDLRWWKRAVEMRESSTLIADAIRQEAERLQVIRNRTVIGPYQTTQRNSYPAQAVIRRWKDERARRTGKRKI